MSYAGPREMRAKQIGPMLAARSHSWRHLDDGICTMLLQAKSDKEMAANLGVPPHAVSLRVQALRRRHKARNRVHLALMLAGAWPNGLLSRARDSA